MTERPEITPSGTGIPLLRGYEQALGLYAFVLTEGTAEGKRKAAAGLRSEGKFIDEVLEAVRVFFQTVQDIDADMSAKERPPTGDDYNDVWTDLQAAIIQIEKARERRRQRDLGADQ